MDLLRRGGLTVATIRVPLSRLGRTMARGVKAAVGALDVEMKRGLGREGLRVMGEVSPVGRPPSATNRGTSRHPGKFRGSWLVSPGAARFAGLADRPAYTIPGPADADRALSGLKPGQAAHLTNDARTDGAADSYASILWVGRRRDSRGRMIGSTQAPAGLAPPLREHLDASAGRIFADAAKAADRSAVAKGGQP